MFLEICMQIYSVVFALSRKINKQKYAKVINRLCKGNKVFLKIKLKGFFTPNPPFGTPLTHGPHYNADATTAVTELSRNTYWIFIS